MKKIIVLIILLIGLSVQAVVIKGGVHYTVESAREEAFSKVRYTIPMDEHKKYLTDPGFSLDKNGKPKIRKFWRRVCFFDNGIYGVDSFSSDYVYYYYVKNGKLESFSSKHYGLYPKLVAKYSTTGELQSVSFSVTRSESYVYDNKQQFLGKWIGHYFYDSKNNVTTVRDY